MKTTQHGLTTIAAIPRTSGAGMALRAETNSQPKVSAQAQNQSVMRSFAAALGELLGETNTRPKTPYPVIVPMPVFGPAYESRDGWHIGTGSWASLCLLQTEIQREREGWELYWRRI